MNSPTVAQLVAGVANMPSLDALAAKESAAAATSCPVIFAQNDVQAQSCPVIFSHEAPSASDRCPVIFSHEDASVADRCPVIFSHEIPEAR